VLPLLAVGDVLPARRQAELRLGRPVGQVLEIRVFRETTDEENLVQTSHLAPLRRRTLSSPSDIETACTIRCLSVKGNGDEWRAFERARERAIARRALFT